MRYFGGKWKISSWIISHMPDHRSYVEPFGGGASILIRKPRVSAEVYNDIDGEVVNLFRVVRDRGHELASAIELTPFAREEYDAAFIGEPTDELERARRTLVKAWMGRGSDSIRKHTGFRLYLGSDVKARSTADEWRRYPEAMVRVIERLRGVVIENADACEVMRDNDAADALHYIDPPYTKKERGGGRYRHDKVDHEALAAVVHELRGKVMLSGYDSPMYRRLYGDWHRVEKPTHSDGALDRIEVLWLSPNCGNSRLF
jgi:DNA adenine methylase